MEAGDMDAQQKDADSKTPLKSWITIALMVAALIAGFIVIPAFGSYLLMLALISLLVIAHELGHFSVAKWSGVKVTRFGFGLPFGPTLAEKQIGETTFCLHPVLLGGYVSFPDDDEDCDLPEDSPRRFENARWANRVAIILAGVTVNAIMGYLLMVLVFGIWGFPGSYALIHHIDKQMPATTDKLSRLVDSPALTAGIQDGDIITAIDGESAKLPNGNISYVSDVLSQHKNTPLNMTVRRGNELVKFTVTPNSQGRVGMHIQNTYEFIPLASRWEAIPRAYTFLQENMILQFKVMGQILTGKVSLKKAGAAGPVGIVKQGGQMIQVLGLPIGLMIAALISMTLAIMNVLPIPMLDGGHLLFLIIEKIKGSPLKKEFQEGSIQVGFYLLMGLMVFILWNDINTHVLGH